MKNTPFENERLLKLILAPHVSEKSTFLGEKHNQTVFRVVADANKNEIKLAVELLWKEQKIEVEKVTTINVKGKSKRFGRFMGKRKDWKKAVVSIKGDQDLNFTNFTNVEIK